MEFIPHHGHFGAQLIDIPAGRTLALDAQAAKADSNGNDSNDLAATVHSRIIACLADLWVRTTGFYP